VSVEQQMIYSHVSPDSQKTRNSEDVLVENYRTFINQPLITDFLLRNGAVHIATEGRSQTQIGLLRAEGHRSFSEKYVQEVTRKWVPELRETATVNGFGYLQTNKSRRACDLFDVIESVGRDSLLEKLATHMKKGTTVPPICIQVNLGEEPQKSGYARAQADSAIERALNLGLDVIGVMAIPPRYEEPAQYFRWLRRLADRHNLPECVMGMSNDYEIAIREGSTSIRIARIIFNERAQIS
jgi:uncharacterized pyridoxal phosphate-containing UPF0001 family protein